MLGHQLYSFSVFSISRFRRFVFSYFLFHHCWPSEFKYIRGNEKIQMENLLFAALKDVADSILGACEMDMS